MREALVFLPAMMSDARLFGPQIADLSRDRAVMTAPLGQGERIEEIASALLDVTPKRFALAGCGFGGIVALEVLRRAPDRITRLCLISTSPLAETPQQAADREPLIVRARMGKLDEVLDEALSLAALSPGADKAEIIALVRAMAAAQGEETFARQMRALQRRRDQQGLLHRLSMPVMVLCGTEDTVVPVKRQALMADLIPGAVLRRIEGAAHLPMLEAPDAVSDALRDWLAMPLVLR